MDPSNDFAARPLPAHLWIPVNRDEAPLMELALAHTGRVGRREFPRLLAARIQELARRAAADTGTPPQRLTEQTFAAAGVQVPADATPDDIAARLMELPAMALLLDSIDWNRSPAHPAANRSFPENAPEQFRALTLADVLARLR